MSRTTTAVLASGTAGAAGGFALGRVADRPSPITVLTLVLVVVTMYYALQTRQTVEEMRADRAVATHRAERQQAHPLLLGLLEDLDKTVLAMSPPYTDHFAKEVERKGAALPDKELRTRLDIAAVACKTLAHDDLADVGASSLVVRLLLEDLRPAVVAALRDEPLPLPGRTWPPRAGVQAAVYDAKKTLAGWS